MRLVNLNLNTINVLEARVMYGVTMSFEFET